MTKTAPREQDERKARIEKQKQEVDWLFKEYLDDQVGSYTWDMFKADIKSLFDEPINLSAEKNPEKSEPT